MFMNLHPNPGSATRDGEGPATHQARGDVLHGSHWALVVCATIGNALDRALKGVLRVGGLDYP